MQRLPYRTTLVAACALAALVQTGSARPARSDGILGGPCGMPPPEPTPFIEMRRPLPEAVGVDAKLAEIEIAGYSRDNFSLANRDGFVALTGHGDTGRDATASLALPKLWPNRTYILFHSETDWNGEPPCFSAYLREIGRFTTAS